MTKPSSLDIVLAVQQHGSKAAAARALGVPASTFKDWYEAAKLEEGEPATTPDTTESIEVNESRDRCTIEGRVHRVETVDDAIAKAGVNLNVWEIERKRIKHYEGMLKDNDGNPVVVPMTSIRIDLKRRDLLSGPELVRRICEDLAGKAPKWPKSAKPGKRTGDLLELSLPDLHIGKLCWAQETGHNYDSRIAERVYGDAIEGLLNGIDTSTVGRILLPTGNDLLHVDNLSNTTTGGTPQDVDGRYQRSYSMAAQMLISAISRLAEIAPVVVPIVPGNHDRERCYYLGETLRLVFRDHPHVEVDASPKLRKYVVHGGNLIGFAHGCDEKHGDLESVMIAEQGEAFTKATRKEWHLGHYHKRRASHVTMADTHGGTVVRILPSLSGTDAWHYQKGYVRGPRAAQAFIYAKDGQRVQIVDWQAPEGVYVGGVA